MSVKLIALTKSLISIDDSDVINDLSAEELLVYIARISNPENQWNTSTADKLLGYLISKKHWSPFDMINMIVEVKTSRAISAQILRHWSIKPQEFSQRYAQVASIEPIEFRLQAEKNRQSSSDVLGTIFLRDGGASVYVEDGISTEHHDLMVDVSNALKKIENLYSKAVNMGIAKESARMILPMASSTSLYLNGSVRSWIHYMEQRCDIHAQKEHRIIAIELKKIFIENFPFTSKALNL